MSATTRTPPATMPARQLQDAGTNATALRLPSPPQPRHSPRLRPSRPVAAPPATAAPPVTALPPREPARRVRLQQRHQQDRLWRPRGRHQCRWRRRHGLAAAGGGASIEAPTAWSWQLAATASAPRQRALATVHRQTAPALSAWRLPTVGAHGRRLAPAGKPGDAST